MARLVCSHKIRPMIAALNGTLFRIVRHPKGWEISRRCDCILGPHWHELGVFRLQRDALDFAREQSR
jgi:hypothetical protein